MSDAVLIPVYNEAPSVAYVLDAVRAVFSRMVIVVNDGSTDGTGAVLAGHRDFCLIKHERNLGYGQSLINGFALARARGIDRLITMDCDGQHKPDHITRFFEALSEGSDIISGSRYLPESVATGTPPPGRQEVNARITQIINQVTGYRLTDAFCGFKAYRLAALDGIMLQEPGYGMPMDLWAKAYAAGLKIRELPIERIYYDHDRSFGVDLDDPEKRFAYYLRVWERALEEAGIR